jgi:hypothetical protein
MNEVNMDAYWDNHPLAPYNQEDTDTSDNDSEESED